MSRRQCETRDRNDIRRGAFGALMTACIVLGIAPFAPARAQNAGDAAAAQPRAPVTEQERQHLLAQAQARRQRASELRRAAESRFDDASAACYNKFLVASCLGDAKQARIKSIQDARQLELEAGDIERDLNRRWRADDEERRAQREAEQREQAARGRAERDLELQRSAAEQAERTRQAEKDGATGARELQQRRQRDAEKAQARAARVAEAHKRAEAARQRRAEIDRRIAEHAQKKAERSAAARPPAQPK